MKVLISCQNSMSSPFSIILIIYKICKNMCSFNKYSLSTCNVHTPYTSTETPLTFSNSCSHLLFLLFTFHLLLQFTQCLPCHYIVKINHFGASTKDLWVAKSNGKNFFFFFIHSFNLFF